MAGGLKIASVLIGTLLLVFAAQAGLVRGLLVLDATAAPITQVHANLFWAFLIVVLSGAVPAFALARFGVRGLGAYVLGGLWSGLLTTFCFVSMWGTIENAGAILHHIQTATGWHYEAPSYLEVLANQFRMAAGLIAEIPGGIKDLPFAAQLLGPVFMTLVFLPTPLGGGIGALIWRVFVRPAAKHV